jgi:hypothetical protein
MDECGHSRPLLGVNSGRGLVLTFGMPSYLLSAFFCCTLSNAIPDFLWCWRTFVRSAEHLKGDSLCRKAVFPHEYYQHPGGGLQSLSMAQVVGLNVQTPVLKAPLTSLSSCSVMTRAPMRLSTLSSASCFDIAVSFRRNSDRLASIATAWSPKSHPETRTPTRVPF